MPFNGSFEIRQKLIIYRLFFLNQVLVKYYCQLVIPLLTDAPWPVVLIGSLKIV